MTTRSPWGCGALEQPPMTNAERLRDALTYALIILVGFLALQFVVVLSHEFTHSIMAWLLGQMDNPLDIVWGSPLTLTGWDESVEYAQMFATGQLVEAAIIAVSPLVMHSTVVSGGLVLLTRGKPHDRWLFHLLYWFVVANLMELIGYVLMRAFATHGDVGIFNQGLGLGPWPVFLAGALALAGALYVLATKALPRIYALFAWSNLPAQWIILGLTAFALFVWGSGLRVIIGVYPDPQWKFGLLGFVLFGLALAVCNPTREWVIRRVQTTDAL